MPRIDGQALCQVRIDCVEALILELIRPNLVRQSDPSALVAPE